MLTDLEAMAVGFAYGHAWDTDLAQALPASVWQGLHDRSLVRAVRDVTDETVCVATSAGIAALGEWIEIETKAQKSSGGAS